MSNCLYSLISILLKLCKCFDWFEDVHVVGYKSQIIFVIFSQVEPSHFQAFLLSLYR